MKISKIFTKSFYTKKRVVWSIIILLLIFGIWYFIFGRKNTAGNIQTAIVSRQNIEQTVLATGQVVSITDLSLSFQAGGKVSSVLVKEGDKAQQGQILAILDQSGAAASLTSAQGALAQAQANYEKVLSGASSQDIEVSRAAVETSKVALDNAKQNLLTKINEAQNDSHDILANSTSSMFTSPSGSDAKLSITGVTFTSQQLFNKINEERVKLNILISEWENKISLVGINSDLDELSKNTLNNLNSVNTYLSDLSSMLGLYSIASTSSGQTSLDAHKATISTALSSVNASILGVNSSFQSLKTAEANLKQSQASLDLKLAPPRQSDIDSAKAQVVSAQGQVALAQSNLNNLILRAPSDGTITQIDIKVGQQAVAMSQALILQDTENLHTESNISEANIASLSLGQAIDYTFDALGPDRHFSGEILTINPSSIIVSGVVNYKVTGSLENIPEIKPGMTANMTVMVARKDNVLAVLSSAVIEKGNGKYVRIIDDQKNKTFHEAQVQIGLQADGGMLEIISGLNEGQEIVTYIKP